MLYTFEQMIKEEDSTEVIVNIWPPDSPKPKKLDDDHVYVDYELNRDDSVKAFDNINELKCEVSCLEE